MAVFTRLSILVLCLVLFGCSKEKEKRDFTIARKATWEGVNLHGTEKKIQGFTNDLFSEIARLEEMQVLVKSVERSGSIIPLLENPAIDVVLSVMEPTPLTLKTYAFSDPFFTFGPVIVTTSSHPITSFDDIKERIVGFERGLNGSFLNDDLHAVFRPYDQITSAVEDLLQGNIDVLILDSVYAYQLCLGIYAGKIVISPLKLPVVRFRAVVKRGRDEEFIRLFDEGLKEVKENGTYEKILRYWEVFVPV